MPMAPPNCWKVWRTPETAPESHGSTTTSAAARGAVGERPQRHHRLLDPALPQHEQREQDDAEAHGAEGGRGPAAARSMDERPGQCHSPGRGGGGAG